jgi:hypothetical protein
MFIGIFGVETPRLLAGEETPRLLVVIPFLKNHVALPVFMKCGSGQHKLKVCATKERYIIRNGIRVYFPIRSEWKINF